MMRDRLLQIRKRARAERLGWVHCDDSEQAYLKVMMDEVFGRQAFVATVIWEKRQPAITAGAGSQHDHDYLMVYASRSLVGLPNQDRRTESADAIYSNPDDDPRGPWLRGDPWTRKPYARGSSTRLSDWARSFEPPQEGSGASPRMRLRELRR